MLVCTYECTHSQKKCIRIICNSGDQDKNDPRPLDPFCLTNPDQNEISTKLDLPESLYFITLLLINIGLWIASFWVFWFGHFDKPLYYNTDEIWIDKIVFVVYMYSLLCTIVSCFIFAKIAYSVSHRCLRMYKEFKDHQIRDENDDNLLSLIKKDDEFTKMGQETLHCFEFWFTIHWISYIVTSFLSIALFFDILTKYIYANTPDSKIGISGTRLSIVGLFTLQHCFLFLYPCFKAAAVTVSREKLIKKVNAYPVDGHSLTLERKQAFIQHLKNKEFGFRISFFCARLRFGFNIAYISLFLGLLGTLLKLTDVFWTYIKSSMIDAV